MGKEGSAFGGGSNRSHLERKKQAAAVVVVENQCTVDTMAARDHWSSVLDEGSGVVKVMTCEERMNEWIDECLTMTNESDKTAL